MTSRSAQFRKRADRDDVAMIDDRDTVAQRLGDLHDVRGHEDGATGSGDLPKDALEQLRAARI